MATYPAPSLSAFPGLTSYQNAENVFWAAGNSFSLALAGSEPPRLLTTLWYTADGVAVYLASVNGIGEVRWLVSHRDGGKFGKVNEGSTAIDYFGLTTTSGDL